MEHRIGIKGSALRLIKSYLFDRYNFVHVNDESSRYDKVSHGVPQGSVLGPLLFILYMVSVDKIIRKQPILFHCYADDTQLYLSTKPGETNQLTNLQSYLKNIKNTMSGTWIQGWLDQPSWYVGMFNLKYHDIVFITFGYS